MRRLMLLAAVVCVLLPASAQASTTLGVAEFGVDDCDQGELWGAPSAVVPAGGGQITSFSIAAAAGGQRIDFKVLRPDPLNPTHVTVVGSSGAVTLNGGWPAVVQTTTLSTPISVQQGDYIGVYAITYLSGCITYTGSGADGGVSIVTPGSDPPDGSSWWTVVNLPDGFMFNISATLDSTPQDTTPPQVSCQSPDADWHAGNVSLACTASDDSALANSGDAAFNLTTSVTAGAEDSNASTDSRSVCDKAGNCTTAGPIAGNMVDRKAPVISLIRPASGDSYLIGSAHAADYSCTDGGSLVATCLGSVAAGANVDTAAVGSHTFTVDSTDNVGNAAPQSSVTYNVIWPYGGFFAPVNNKDSFGNYVLNVAKAGSAIPVKFSLGGNRGLNVLAGGYPTSGAIDCSSATTDLVELTVTAGDGSLSYDATTDTYTYVWKSAKAWAGTCRQLAVKLADGTTHKASFQFK